MFLDVLSEKEQSPMKSFGMSYFRKMSMKDGVLCRRAECDVSAVPHVKINPSQDTTQEKDALSYSFFNCQHILFPALCIDGRTD